VPEARHPVCNEIGPHHAFGQARLPGLVDHVASMRRFEVRRHAIDQRRQTDVFRLAATLRMAQLHQRRMR